MSDRINMVLDNSNADYWPPAAKQVVLYDAASGKYRSRDLVEVLAELGILDAFGRLRVSEPTTIFTGKQILDNEPLTMDDQEVSGTGTGSAWSQATAASAMTVTAATAGKRVRQSRVRPSYQPGKSHRIFVTFTMAAAETGLDQRVGYFDDNNGIFLEVTDTTVNIVQRSNRTGSPVDTAVAQASWSEDVFDGTGDSGVTLDLTKSQIFIVDFEWLGVGAVRAGFVVDGAIYWAHHFHQANNAAGVYMSSPNLPVRWEIENDGNAGAATLEAICASVDSEGGVDDVGINRTVDTGIAGFVTTADTNLYPALAIRLDSAGLDAFVRPSSVGIICTSTSNYRWALLLNPTIAGTALSFTDVANSAAEVAKPTNATTVSAEGTLLASGYAADTAQSKSEIAAEIGRFQLGSFIDGTSDIVVLAIQNLSSGAETYHASLSWRESA